jgi:leucyl/phenylalanyl-tRNA--protein transferase
MPIFELDMEDLRFPAPALAEPDGCLAIGGDFRPMRMISAYASGIFPWMTWQGRPVWYSPDPRMVLEPDRLHVPRSLAKIIRRGDFEVRLDTALEAVIEACRKATRPGQRGSWITRAYVRGLLELGGAGVAHSAEAWRDGKLVGGLYGLSLGRVFFGESMFADAPDASKVAFATLTHALAAGGWRLIDCQQETSHLARFGGIPWSRARYLEALGGLVTDTPEGPPWGRPLPPWDGRMPVEAVTDVVGGD